MVGWIRSRVLRSLLVQFPFSWLVVFLSCAPEERPDGASRVRLAGVSLAPQVDCPKAWAFYARAKGWIWTECEIAAKKKNIPLRGSKNVHGGPSKFALRQIKQE